MNLEYFIAKRLISAKRRKSTISTPIIKIAITAIAIGMIMMIISVATGIGLQQKIREKVAAFNGHIIISNYDDNQSKVSVEPISIQQTFYPTFKTVQGIDHIQAVASKAGIIRTEKTFEGILFKGVGKDYQWSQLEEYLTQGRLPQMNESLTNEVMLSKYLAQRLELQLCDTFSTYFMKENTNQMPNLRVFKLVGIYDSGFQEFDQSYLIGDIRHVQKMNKWQPTQVGHFEIFLEDFSAIETKGKEIYKHVLETSKTWKNSQNLMYVVGATKAEYFTEIRKIVHDSFLLVPGVGAQGGSLQEVCKYGMNATIGLLINSSRGIIYASNGSDFAEKAREEAIKIQEEMKEILKTN